MAEFEAHEFRWGIFKIQPEPEGCEHIATTTILAFPKQLEFSKFSPSTAVIDAASILFMSRTIITRQTQVEIA